MKLLSEHIKPFPKLMLLTALLLSGFVSATIISAAFILLFPDFNNTPAGGLLVQGICSLVTFGLSALVYFWVFDRDFRFALSLPKDKRLFVWAAVLPICLIPLIDYLNILNGQIHFRGEEIWRQMQETSSLTVERLFSLGGVWGFVAVTFVMAVIPAVVEEFFFRCFAEIAENMAQKHFLGNRYQLCNFFFHTFRDFFLCSTLCDVVHNGSFVCTYGKHLGRYSLPLCE